MSTEFRSKEKKGAIPNLQQASRYASLWSRKAADRLAEVVKLVLESSDSEVVVAGAGVGGVGIALTKIKP
jgi:hypothetical protein